MAEIRSEFNGYQSFGRYVISILFIVLVSLFYFCFFGRHPTPFLSPLGGMGIFLTLIMPSYLVAQMKLNYKTTIIDTDDQTISFEMFVLPVTYTYQFTDFDGYVETQVRDKNGDYKCFYLVKDG